MKNAETINGMIEWAVSGQSTGGAVTEVVLRSLASEVKNLRSHIEFHKSKSAWKKPLVDGYPERDEWVLATYKGLYPPRYVRYWVSGMNHHFGGQNADIDGKGSQPITHWMLIPEIS